MFAYCTTSDTCPLKAKCLRHTQKPIKIELETPTVKGDYYANSCNRFVEDENPQELRDDFYASKVEQFRDLHT